jgi:hypothetical protein
LAVQDCLFNTFTPDHCYRGYGYGHVVLYGCETSSPLRKEHKLRVFENRVLKRTLGLKREEVTEGWRRPHNEIFITCTLHQVSLG